MKCLIGPSTCGLIFSREFTEKIFAETGLLFFDRPFPKKDWLGEGEELNEDEFLSQFAAIIKEDDIFFLDSDSPSLRTSEITLRLVEELGKKAFAGYKETVWKVIDVPEGVHFGIGEGEDGSEWIYEKHRTWS